MKYRKKLGRSTFCIFILTNGYAIAMNKNEIVDIFEPMTGELIRQIEIEGALLCAE